MFATGTPFYAFYSTNDPTNALTYDYPAVSFSGSQTLSWTSGTSGGSLVYGVYAATSGSKPAAGYGLRTFTDNLITQIDGQYSNITFASKRTISLAAGNTTSFTVTAARPLLAYRGTGWVSVLYAKGNGNGTWTIGIQNNTVTASAGTIYVFDTVPNASQLDGSGYGLRVRDAAENVVFDSRYRYANIAGGGTIPATTPATVQTSTLSKNNLAVIISPGFFYRQITQSRQSSGGGTTITTVGVMGITGAGINGTTLTIGGCAVISSDEDLYASFDTLPGYYTLVDVSLF